MADAAGMTIRIDLAALRRNWRRLADKAAPAECAAAVKADAYGIGLGPAVEALAGEGCKTFFVALPEEGAAARRHAPDAAIYVLNGFFAGAEALYRAHDLRPVLNHAAELAAWADCGGGSSALHVDTGMNRLGFGVDEAMALAGSPALSAAGVGLVMSHFACADEPAHPLNARQIAATGALKPAFRLPVSLANSAGIHLGAAAHFEMVRPGIALYGGRSAPGADTEVVVTATARVLQIREVPAGQTVGYGGAKRLDRPTRVAVLSAGYADGYPRAAGSGDDRDGAAVLIAGHAAPVLGRVSMDLLAVDVTRTPEDAVAVGAEAELFGPSMRVDTVADCAGTIAYELLTRLGRRGRRLYAGGA